MIPAPRDVALAGLARLCEPPVAREVAEFVGGVGAETAWRALVDRSAPGAVLSAVAPRLADPSDLRARALDDLRIAAESGAQIFGPGDAEWPAECFVQLSWVAPYDKCQHAAAPLALYRRGSRWPTEPSRSIAIVGSRAATGYGVRVATEIAADAVADGCTVVSGAAFGIDAAAHRGALHGLPGAGAASGVPTVAVLACGIDRAYPAAHRSLIDSIALDGAVVSEYAPGSVPARHRFLVRNRLIAAFAEATVVVEAGRRSGSLNTATTALNVGRPLAAVPGPVSSAMSIGCHDLVRDAKAVLVTSWRDIAELLGPLRTGANPHRPPADDLDELDLISSRVHGALPSRGSVAVEAIAIEAALPAPDVMGALAVLHLAGLVDQRDGLWYRVSPSGSTRGGRVTLDRAAHRDRPSTHAAR